jgi:uroporphyrinogen-III synthase
VVLRTADTPGAIDSALADAGMRVAIVAVADVVDRPHDEVAHAVGRLARYRWVAVTSTNAARRLAPWSASWPPSVRVAAIGPGTAAAVEAAGVRCAVTSRAGTAADLAGLLDGGPVLFLAASSARDDLPRTLARREIELVTVVAYDVVPRTLDAAARDAIRDADVVVAMAPVAIDALDALGVDDRDVARTRPLVTIGPTTTARAASLGWEVAAEAATRDAHGVVAAVDATLGGSGAAGR